MIGATSCRFLRERATANTAEPVRIQDRHLVIDGHGGSLAGPGEPEPAKVPGSGES